ncbi:hypothetical protein GCM10009613_30670 [Pseudonocardia kongjuensis]|uniref:Uncharacterized protein n=1 Tax=Pseudonocardia kongjuensis TaxID=102227 RepID=A0ABN1XWN0_9PSEU
MTDDTYFLSDAYNRWADELRPVGHGPRLGDIPVPPELHAHISRLVKRYYEYSRVDDPARKGRMITMNTVAARMLAARHSRGPFRIAPQSRGVIIYSDSVTTECHSVLSETYWRSGHSPSSGSIPT